MKMKSVDLVDRIAGKERFEVFCCHVDQADPGLYRSPGDVRCDHAVGRAEQGVI